MGDTHTVTQMETNMYISCTPRLPGGLELDLQIPASGSLDPQAHESFLLKDRQGHYLRLLNHIISEICWLARS